MNIRWPLVLGLAVVSACSIRAEQLKQEPLNVSRSVPLDVQTDKKFLLYPFEDLRGGEYAYLYPTSLIPVVDFFHIGAYNMYPEQAGILMGNRGGEAIVSVGSLDSAMPYLLATMMRLMRYTGNATPLESLNAKSDLRSFDYVIQGKVKETRFTQHMNIIPLGVLGILGVPYVFASMDMEYEVLLFKAKDLTQPLARKTYKYSDSMAVGLYYNHAAAFKMFIGGLEKTLAQAVADLANAAR